jgi:hypothetical protein
MSLNDDMYRSLLEFQAEVNDFVHEKLPRTVKVWQYKIYGETFTKLVRRTPVRTGNTKANWQVTKTVFSSRVFTKKVDPEGDDTIAKGLAVIRTIKPYGDCYFNNAVPHIQLLEDGSSSQAPNGWIALTLAEIADKYEFAGDAI